jgi:hypothetical protein
MEQTPTPNPIKRDKIFDNTFEEQDFQFKSHHNIAMIEMKKIKFN